MVRQRKTPGQKKTRPPKTQPSSPKPLSIIPPGAEASRSQETVLPAGPVDDLREQIRQLTNKLDALQTSAPEPSEQPKENKEEEEGPAEEEEGEALLRSWKDGVRLGFAFVQDVLLDVVPYGYNTLDAVGPLLFWLLLVPLTVIGAGFAFKMVEFGSFMMSVNAVRHPCNSTNVLAAMEEFGLREAHCGEDAADPRVSWWELGGANFCALGGAQVVEMTAGWELPLPEEYELTENGLLGVRMPSLNRTDAIETDSLLWGLWQASVHGQPVKFHVCGPGYVFWDTNHLTLGMMAMLAVMFLLFTAKWVQDRVYPLLGIEASEEEAGPDAGIAQRIGSFVFYAILLGYVGKALVVWNFWGGGCSAYIEHRSAALSLRELAAALSQHSYFTAGDTLMEELGLDEVDFGSCDLAHLLAYSRFKPDQAGFYNFLSPSHLWYAGIAYMKFKVYKFIALLAWRKIIRPVWDVLVGRCRRVQRRRLVR